MDEKDKESELLDKLDGLIRSGRGRKPRDPPPVLTEAIPDPTESAIPTLTDAVEDAPEVPNDSPQSSRPSDQKLVADRLLASVSREIVSLSKALPAHQSRLSVLHRSLRFALPELVRLRWQDDGNGDEVSEEGPDQPSPEG